MTRATQTVLIKTALAAVMSAAAVADKARDRQSVHTKGNPRDIVTQTDIAISALLVDRLSPTQIPVISEEEAQALTQLPPTFWAVDPIDGTVNFSNGLSQFAICAGLVANGVFELGVVCAPALDELYFTLHEGSALFNGRPFRLAHQTTANALVAASFSSKAEASQYDLFRSVNESTRGCLRTGSAALNICWAATGRLQAAFGFEAKLWDVSAALAIARAAGCELVVRPGGDALSVDYCVGTADTVQHITQLAHDHGLWS